LKPEVAEHPSTVVHESGPIHKTWENTILWYIKPEIYRKTITPSISFYPEKYDVNHSHQRAGCVYIFSPGGAWTSKAMKKQLRITTMAKKPRFFSRSKFWEAEEQL